jgi:hypothetical protein
VKCRRGATRAAWSGFAGPESRSKFDCVPRATTLASPPKRCCELRSCDELLNPDVRNLRGVSGAQRAAAEVRRADRNYCSQPASSDRMSRGMSQATLVAAALLNIAPGWFSGASSVGTRSKTTDTQLQNPCGGRVHSKGRHRRAGSVTLPQRHETARSRSLRSGSSERRACVC